MQKSKLSSQDYTFGKTFADYLMDKWLLYDSMKYSKLLLNEENVVDIIIINNYNNNNNNTACVNYIYGTDRSLPSTEQNIQLVPPKEQLTWTQYQHE